MLIKVKLLQNHNHKTLLHYSALSMRRLQSSALRDPNLGTWAPDGVGQRQLT